MFNSFIILFVVPTGPAAGPNPSPSGISKSSDQSSSSNNSSQRFIDVS